MTQDKDPKDMAAAVGHIPSGLFIVCALDESSGQIDGFLASWVQQVSFEPLLVSLGIKPGRPAYDLIKAGKTFTINVVGDHDKNYLKHFWSGYDPDKNPFSELPHQTREDGAVIMEQAKSTIVCKLKDSHQPGDHEIVIADVLDSVVSHTDATPTVHIRKSGLSY